MNLSLNYNLIIMKSRFCLIVAISLLAVAVLMGCRAAPAEDFDKSEPLLSIHAIYLQDIDSIMIEFQFNVFDFYNQGERVILTDSYSIERIHKIYSTLSYLRTPEPMRFPRFLITFLYDDAPLFAWGIDKNSVGYLRNTIGNARINEGDIIYAVIEELFEAAGS